MRNYAPFGRLRTGCFSNHAICRGKKDGWVSETASYIGGDRERERERDVEKPKPPHMGARKREDFINHVQ